VARGAARSQKKLTYSSQKANAKIDDQSPKNEVTSFVSTNCPGRIADAAIEQDHLPGVWACDWN
jgi:hypothetical protein